MVALECLGASFIFLALFNRCCFAPCGKRARHGEVLSRSLSSVPTPLLGFTRFAFAERAAVWSLY